MAYEEDLDDILENAVFKAINCDDVSFGYFVDSEGNIISNIAILLEEEE
tara:strand:+ start:398 stop:544 length:147 start_codon:yes stop_codon:yes gene_type:complete